jgi:hypothetical protein
MHSSIQIGKKVLHWFDSSIVLIKHFDSNETLLALDIDEIDLNDKEEVEKINKVKKVILMYNTQKQYSTKNCNCQHFCDDILKAMNMEIKFSGQISNYYIFNFRKFFG